MSRVAAPRARTGFTLIEVLAVLFLTALVLGVALDFFVDLSNESTHATESTRELRRATSLVDRIARDVERTMLVKKPEDTDPLAHPWVFLAEPKFAETGYSDRIKFVRTADPLRNAAAVPTDLNVVAYSLEPHGDGSEGYELHRWSSPTLPERLDRDFPRPDDEASLVLADHVASFGMRFMGEAGEWADRWDSSQIIESSALPVAVEIEVALMPAMPASALELQPEPVVYKRRVLLPLKPIDLVALTEPEEGDEDGEDDDDLTVADCVDFSLVGAGPPSAEPRPGGQLTPADVEALQDIVRNAPNLPWAPYRALFGNHPSVKEECR